MELQKIGQTDLRYDRVGKLFTEAEGSDLLNTMILNILRCEIFFDRKVRKLDETYSIVSAHFNKVLF